MRRGFKSEAERTAAEARTALGLSAHALIDPWAYAALLKVRVLEFKKLALPSRAVSQLTVVDGDSWSAMTLQVDGMFAIVLNPTHAITRQRNDLMHELAHIKLQHAPARVEVSETGLLLLSDYSDEQEQEADWLAAALLLPRDTLIRLRAASHSVTDIARHFGVSEPLCEWRLRMTGVDIQLKRTYR